MTETIKKQLIENNPKQNGKIIVKYFDPCGAGTWLITGMEDDGDTMWGLCDLGLGCVEFGTVSLSELQSVRGALGLGIERDLHFKGGNVKDYQDRDSLAGV
jgi:hypothetical protein